MATRVLNPVMRKRLLLLMRIKKTRCTCDVRPCAGGVQGFAVTYSPVWEPISITVPKASLLDTYIISRAAERSTEFTLPVQKKLMEKNLLRKPSSKSRILPLDQTKRLVHCGYDGTKSCLPPPRVRALLFVCVCVVCFCLQPHHHSLSYVCISLWSIHAGIVSASRHVTIACTLYMHYFHHSLYI